MTLRHAASGRGGGMRMTRCTRAVGTSPMDEHDALRPARLGTMVRGGAIQRLLAFGALIADHRVLLGRVRPASSSTTTSSGSCSRPR